MPLPQLSTGSNSSSNATAIPQLQLMAVQCLTGSTSFAASCIEQFAANANSPPCSLLLASFYAHMLMGGAGSRLTLSCCRLTSQLEALHPPVINKTTGLGRPCNWVSFAHLKSHVAHRTFASLITGECLALLSGYLCDCCSSPPAAQLSSVCKGWRCCFAGCMSHVTGHCLSATSASKDLSGACSAQSRA
jgi:hypothetical protein